LLAITFTFNNQNQSGIPARVEHDEEISRTGSGEEIDD